VALGEGRVEEVVQRRVGHAEAPHDSLGPSIGDGSERHDLGQPKVAEGVGQGGVASLGGVAMAPIGAGETPANFHARGEAGLPAWDREANEADEGGGAGDFHRPEAELGGFEPVADAGGQLVAFGTRECGWEVFHDARIGVERGEGFEIGAAPVAEQEARRGEGRCGH
jgi:hypothetical protein